MSLPTSTTDEDRSSADAPPERLQFRLAHALYAIALLSSGMATFAWDGVVAAGLILFAWGCVLIPARKLSRLELAIIGLILLGLAVLLLLPAAPLGDTYYHRMNCMDRLGKIGMALHQYEAEHGSFPPAYITDGNGRPMHSWRVLILPYLGEEKRYKQYRFDEAWDGPHNRELLLPVPEVFVCPHSGEAGSSMTSYVAVVGEGTMWPGSTGRKRSEVTDPLEATLLVIEAGEPAIPWMAPHDLTLDEAVALLATDDVSELPPTHNHRREWFASTVYYGRMAVFADVHREGLRYGYSPEGARSWFVTDDGPGADRLEGINLGRRRWDNLYRLGLFVLIALLPIPWAWRVLTEASPAASVNEPTEPGSGA